jgi:hypothetical protein
MTLGRVFIKSSGEVNGTASPLPPLPVDLSALGSVKSNQHVVTAILRGFYFRNYEISFHFGIKKALIKLIIFIPILATDDY